jgi:hypothetical protein
MKKRREIALSGWITRHAIVVWIGILLNLAVIIPLIFCPNWLLDLLGIPLRQIIWAQFAGWLLFIISCYYVPATIDFQRFRINTWLAVMPSRAGGALFFFLAVFLFGQPPGFLIGVVIDGVIGLLSLICLIKIETILKRQGQSGNSL